jgi:GNAT superfamily N-acetyltransferase
MTPLPTPAPLLLAIYVLLPLAAFAALGWLVRTRGLQCPSWIQSALTSRWMPVAAGIIAAALTWFVWGSLNESGVIHDERAYLLQARIFATGHWTGYVPPLPEFFEQMHVFVVPRLAAKYPPGHSLLLAVGVLFGLSGLVPVILSGVAGALVFAIARRLAEPIVALFTWLLWSTSVANLLWRASYFSQTVSLALWLVALWYLLLWKRAGKRYQLLIIVSALAWMYLTRPLTAIALGAPIGVFVLMTVWRRKLWGQLAVSAAVAIPVLALNFLWHKETLGEWRANPYARYSQVYFPFDKPGFGTDASRPLRERPEEVAWVGDEFTALHAAHRPRNIPRILLERVLGLLLTLGYQWRAFLIGLIVVGALRVRGPARFGVVSVFALLVTYLIFAHPPWWTLYYVEVFPVLFFVATVELVRFGRTALRLDEGASRAAVALALALVIPCAVIDVINARKLNDRYSDFGRTAARVLETIPEQSAVVFVRYPPNLNHHLSLITNTPDYRTARLWIVYDRGADNCRLLRMTDRSAYRLSTETWKLERLR